LRHLALACFVALALTGFFASEAAAVSYFHPFISAFGKAGTPASKFEKVESLAVNQSTGDIYVMDTAGGSDNAGKIYRFTSSGAPHNFTEGAATGTNRLSGLTLGASSQIAIAPAGAPGGTAGDIYVAAKPSGQPGPDGFQGRVDVFSPGGLHLGTIDGSGNPNPDSGGSPFGVAVDFAGNVYLAQCKDFISIYSTCEGHVDKYVPTANPLTNADFDSELSGFGQPSELAASASALYVRGDRFDLSVFPGGDGSVLATGKGTPFSEGNFNSTTGTAEVPYVDPSNEDVYFAANGSAGFGVRQYDAAGTLLSTIPVPNEAVSVAVDATSGNVYASSRETNGLESRVRIYGPGIQVEPASAAIDPVTGLDYESAHFSGTVNAGGSGESQATTYRFQCTPACPGLQGDRSVTADGADHAVSDDATGLAPGTAYEVTLIAKGAAGEVKDTTSFETPAKPPIELPQVTIDAVTSFTATTAHLTGTVDPGGSEALQATTYRFEYSADGLKWIALADQGPILGEAPQGASAELTGLEPNKSYSVRLRATNAGGEDISDAPNPSFTTQGAPPFGEATGATRVLATSAQLNARINPGNAQTSYYFQWGPNDCAASPCASVPSTEDADAGSGGKYVFVNTEVEGLSPEATYSYRLVAKNAGGQTTTVSKNFTTAQATAPCANEALRSGPSSHLPDCRAYEMVSPRQKNGGDIIPNPSVSRSSADGNAVSYISLTAFAGALGSNDIGAEYISRRGGAEGWSTYPITPQHESPTIPSIGSQSQYVGEFAPDLSKGVFLGLNVLPGITSPNVAEVANLYLGTGLGSTAPSLTLATDSTTLLPPDREGFYTDYLAHINLDGASEDLSHLIFETSDNLTGDTAGKGMKLYEWVNGTVRLAGVLPDVACANPPCPAPASVGGAGSDPGGQKGLYTSHTGAISDDGSRIFFTAGALSESTVNTGFQGDLYVREGGVTTTQIDLSERTSSIPAGAGLSQFQWATPDGGKVFFLSTKALVDEDQDGSGRDLYEYDLAAPVSHRLTLLTPDRITPDALGITFVVGASENGSVIYFTGAKPAGKEGYDALYVLHGDMVRFIGLRGSVAGSLVTNWGDRGFHFAGRGGSMARVAPDGRHVLFQSATDQGLGYDNRAQHLPFDINEHHCALGPGWDSYREGEGRCAELYLYSYDSGEVVCVSCNPSGALPAGSASFETRALTSKGQSEYLPAPLSEDGRRVFFNSRDALVPRDANGKVDVYEYDTESGKLFLVSSGQCNCDSLFEAASPDGKDVFFATTEQLVARDTDNLYDVYDARVGGGIAIQNQLPAPGCEGDACQPPPATPDSPTPASAGFSGPGNPPAPRAKPQKKKKHHAGHRHHGKSRHHAKRRHQRRAHQDQGRAGR
jgi:hypothetical protein